MAANAPVDIPVDDHEYETLESDAKYVFSFCAPSKCKSQTVSNSMDVPYLSHEPVPSAQAAEAEQFLSSIMPAGCVLQPSISNVPDPDFL
jgi:hypothetical protein